MGSRKRIRYKIVFDGSSSTPEYTKQELNRDGEVVREREEDQIDFGESGGLSLYLDDTNDSGYLYFTACPVIDGTYRKAYDREGELIEINLTTINDGDFSLNEDLFHKLYLRVVYSTSTGGSAAAPSAATLYLTLKS